MLANGAPPRTSSVRSGRRIEAPVRQYVVIIVERPPRIVGAMKLHSLFRDVKVGFEVLLDDMDRRHALKFCGERLGTGQEVCLGQPVRD